MPHIHCEPGQHDHTVSFFIVRTDFEQPTLMYHTHRKTGLLSMFGGHVELHENPWETLLHELKEETGYDPEQVKVLQPSPQPLKVSGCITHAQPFYVHTAPFPTEPLHYHTDMMYALVASEEPHHAPAPGESSEFFYLDEQQLRRVPKGHMNEAWRELGFHVLEHVFPTWAPVNFSEFS